MKACVLEGVGNLVYKDIEDVSPKAGEVLLKIRACGICSSDIPRVFKTGTYHFPTVPGHEFSGEIVGVGGRVSEEYIGKKAAVFPLLPCRECESCKQEQYARCDNYNYFGSRCDGGFAEYIAVPLWNLVFFDEMDFTTAALCEPGSVALHSIRAAELSSNDNVLIIGTGTIGILAALWAGKFSGNVTIAGRTESKLNFVKSLGRFEVIDNGKETVNDQYDVVIECVGTNAAVGYALNSVKKGGRVILTGNPASDVLLPKNDYWKILRKEITLKGTWNSYYGSGENDWKHVIRYLKSEEETARMLITHKYALADCGKAFDVLKDPNEMTVKVMFVMEG